MIQSQEQRFAFGRNWRGYLTAVKAKDMENSRNDLSSWIGHDLKGKTFLDIGSGSGLSSLAAVNLGCNELLSFDYDLDSVEATKSMKAKYFNESQGKWDVMQGSVLDKNFMDSLPRYDFVYSWGVLHHTGEMWKAIELASEKVADKGGFYIAIYNDQGWLSRYWFLVKKTYVSSGSFGQRCLEYLFYTYFALAFFVADCLRIKNPANRYREGRRGMKVFYDVKDWVGGYPFEVASPNDLENFLQRKGFKTVKSKTVGRRHGCNEFLFQKI